MQQCRGRRLLSNATMSKMSIFVKCNNVEDVNLCQMQQCRRCQSLSNVTMSKMSIFVKCKVITKSPNHPFLPHFLIFFNKGQETHNPQSAASTPSYTATPKYRCIASYRRSKPRRPCRCRVLPRVRPPAANACGEITYTGCGLTRGKTLHRRGLRHENRHIYGLRSYIK